VCELNENCSLRKASKKKEKRNSKKLKKTQSRVFSDFTLMYAQGFLRVYPE